MTFTDLSVKRWAKMKDEIKIRNLHLNILTIFTVILVLVIFISKLVKLSGINDFWFLMFFGLLGVVFFSYAALFVNKYEVTTTIRSGFRLTYGDKKNSKKLF